MASSLDDLVTNLQSGVQNIGLLVQAIQRVFPQTGGTSPTASDGAATLPANPEEFMVVTLTTGAVRKIALYNE